MNAKKMAFKLRIQTYQLLTNDDEVCIPSLSTILLAVTNYSFRKNAKKNKKALDHR